MSPSLIALLGGLGVGTILAAVVTGLFSKRKLSAEATEIITRAASGVVESLREELARSILAREKAEVQHVEELQRRTARWEAQWIEVQRALEEHVAWDADVRERMKAYGVDLPPAPPFPHRWTTD